MALCFLCTPCILRETSFTIYATSWKRPQSLRTNGCRVQRPTCELSPRDQAREEALQRQQEILARRRNKKKNREYFEAVTERRRQLEKGIQSRRLQVVEGEDPLIAWKKLRQDGKIKDIGYDEAPQGSIPMPMASFGIPRFDNGERFDLRLPHVEHGYTDEDADAMGKLMRFFGFGKKKKDKGSGGNGTGDQ